MKYTIVVPCYNEEDNIERLMDRLGFVTGRLPEHCSIEWVLVENGSVDGTRKKLEHACKGKTGYTIAYVDVNQGYGYGIMQGIKAAKGDYIGWIHADLQIDPGYLLHFIRIAENLPKGEKVFFKGHRRNRHLSEYFFTNGMTVFTSIVLGCWMEDIGAVPVMAGRELFRDISKAPYDFSMEAYFYWMAKKSGCRIQKVPVTVKGREKGRSSWNKGLKSRIGFSMQVMKSICKMKKGYGEPEDTGSYCRRTARIMAGVAGCCSVLISFYFFFFRLRRPDTTGC